MPEILCKIQDLEVCLRVSGCLHSVCLFVSQVNKSQHWINFLF